MLINQTPILTLGISFHEEMIDSLGVTSEKGFIPEALFKLNEKAQDSFYFWEEF